MFSDVNSLASFVFISIVSFACTSIVSFTLTVITSFVNSPTSFVVSWCGLIGRTIFRFELRRRNPHYFIIMADFAELFGDTLICKEGSVPVSDLKGKVVGLYFS